MSVTIRTFLCSSPTAQDLLGKMPPRLWQCCNCNDRPINIAVHGEQCGKCKHERCGNCKTDSKIDPPSPRRATFMNDYTYHHNVAYQPQPPVELQNSRSVWRDTAITSSTRLPRNALSKRHMRLGSSRPPTQGWWYCSECKNMNNPALSSGRCTVCGHKECSRCSAVRR